MVKAILIEVADGDGGYGDFLFALKLSKALKKKYADRGEEVPPVYLVTQKSGQEKIQALGGGIEFGVDILTPDDLKERVETVDATKKIDPGTLIIGPVFNHTLMKRVDTALSSLATPIPVLLTPEYGFTEAEFISTEEKLVKTKLHHCVYADTIYSGLDRDKSEFGILISDDLTTPTPPSAWISQLDKKIRESLVGIEAIETYRATTELSVQYSHDSYKVCGEKPAIHFLNIQRRLAKDSSKNQDVLMIGKNLYRKQQALLDIKDKLIADGFTRITFYNADTQKEEVLYEATDESVAKKTYRVIYTAGMSHASMIACTALSGPLIGATGDQSFGEALSSNKIMVYECLEHKKELLESYDAAMVREAGGDEIIKEVLSLLRTAKDDSQYARLGELLIDPAIQAKLIALNKAVVEKSDLSAKIHEGVDIKAEKTYEMKVRLRAAVGERGGPEETGVESVAP
jgi:hypothetical protein